MTHHASKAELRRLGRELRKEFPGFFALLRFLLS